MRVLGRHLALTMGSPACDLGELIYFQKGNSEGPQATSLSSKSVAQAITETMSLIFNKPLSKACRYAASLMG